jgi:hypothetical protein
MLEQSSSKKFYYGSNQPKIDALNDFMKEPVMMEYTPMVQSKIIVSKTKEWNTHKKNKT